MEPKNETFVGIDVSKDTLDVASLPDGAKWKTSNDENGIDDLKKRLFKVRPTLIVFEASGGFEMEAVSTLAGSGLPVAVVNPRQTRDFAKALGNWPKPTQLMPRF